MQVILDSKEMNMAIQKMAREILEDTQTPEKIALVGITTRGVTLAGRIVGFLQDANKIEVPVGILDINLYRDDLSRVADHPVVKRTEIPFSIDSRVVYLIDDVLYTGRTIRCALDALFDLGRPDLIGLAVLVDRGGRELPIQADIVGIHHEAKRDEIVHVKFAENDGIDSVEVASKETI